MITEEDRALFLSKLKDVKPLKHSNKVVAKNSSKKRHKKIQQTLKRIKIKQRSSSVRESIVSPDSFSTVHTTSVTPEERLLFHQKGIRIQELAKLKKGLFSNQAQLDLHGYTSEEAISALHNFIYSAYQEGLRHIRIVHGKGYNSEEHYPIIKNLVNQQLRGISVILAFCSTPEKDGGTGAINILLKNAHKQRHNALKL